MSRDNFLGRGEKRSPSHRRAPKQEKELGKRFKGRLVPGSGSGHQKGDVRVPKVARIEAKTTKNKSFSVTREMIDKVTNAGIAHGELPAMVVEFLDADGHPESEVAVIPMWALEMLINRASGEDGET